MELTVYAAATEEQRREILEFRYRVYVDEMGLNTPDADHETRMLYDPLDDVATHWALHDGERVLGSLRLVHLDDVPDPSAMIERFQLGPAIDAFGTGAICDTGRFMLDPGLRHGTAILRLVGAPFADPRHEHLRLNYGDCSPHMLPFYVHMGYREYAPAFNDPNYGFKFPIVMLVRDQEHMKRMRSPLARLIRDRPDDEEAREWFASTYPDHLQPRTARFAKDDEFYNLLASEIGGCGIEELPPFLGFTREDVQRFLADANVVSAAPGDRVVRQGEPGDTMFVVLAGSLAVVRERPDNGEPEADDAEPLDLLSPGDLFGEAGFLTGRARHASVIAGGPSELLVLPGDGVRRWHDKEPALYATFVVNLARLLADRLTLGLGRTAGAIATGPPATDPRPAAR